MNSTRSFHLGAALVTALFVGCSKDTPPPAPAPPETDTEQASADTQAPPATTKPHLVPRGETITGGATPEELVAARAAWKPQLPPNKIDVVPAPGVNVLEPAQQNQVVVSPAGLRFKAADHPDVLTWEKGKVLVSAPAEKGSTGQNPFGFARKVARVEQIGEDIVVTTTAVGLEEIIHGEFQLEFDPAAGQDVEWADFAANAEWAAATLYTNSLPLTDHYPDGLRVDTPPIQNPPPQDGGDPFIVNALKKGVRFLGSASNVVVNAVKTGATAVGGAVVDTAKTVGGAVKTGASAVGSFVSSTASGAARTVSSITDALYEEAKALYQTIVPQSLGGEATLDPEFDFNAIDFSIVSYKYEKDIKESGKFPMKLELSADSNLKGRVNFAPKLSVGAEIPNPIAIGDKPPMRVWLDVDAALTAKLTLDLELEAALASAGGKAGSPLEEALNEASDFTETVLNDFRKQLFGNEDTKPAGNWKKTVFLSKPKVSVIMLKLVPVVLTGTFQIDVECGFELKAQLEAEATLESVHTFKYRAEYIQNVGIQQRDPEYKHTPSFALKVLGAGEAAVSCSIIPRVNVFIYDTIGLNAGVRGSIIATASYESECAPDKWLPDGEVSLGLSAGIGIPVGARLQVPGSSWGGKAAVDKGIDIGPIEIWNIKIPIVEKTWEVPGIGYCSPTCENGRTSASEPETDLDCGDKCPVACAQGKRCKVNSDCRSDLFCTSGICSPNHCEDGMRSGNETGVDCGGPTCAPCSVGSECTKPADCASGSCKFEVLRQNAWASVVSSVGTCEADPCNDGQRSPGECGIDCGGKCPLCPVGAICGDKTQCQSGLSNHYQCVASCGAFGEDCCGGKDCNGGLVCQDSTCQCPTHLGITCGGGCCAAGQICDAGKCTAPPQGCIQFPTDVRGTCSAGACPTSCRDQLRKNPGSQSGIYTLQPDPTKPPFEARCDMSMDGGGWTLVGYEPSGSPSDRTSGALASLFAETGSPSGVASGSAAGFIGPRFSFTRGDYTHLRLKWCDPAAGQNLYQIFRTTEEIFEDSERAANNGTIVLSEFQSNDSELNQQIPTPDSARFCRARTSTLKPGDTSWGVKGANEQNFGCGCNSGSWQGVGSYYGGTGEQCTTCMCFGGGWSGTAGNGVIKGNINRNTFYLWVR